MMMTNHIKHNKLACRLCGDIIESTHRHDFKYCKCGEIGIDGGREYIRCGANNINNVINMVEYYSEAEWAALQAHMATPEYKEARDKFNKHMTYQTMLALGKRQ